VTLVTAVIVIALLVAPGCLLATGLAHRARAYDRVAAERRAVRLDVERALAADARRAASSTGLNGHPHVRLLNNGEVPS
jgi:hypothetical protein